MSSVEHIPQPVERSGVKLLKSQSTGVW